MRNPNSDAAYAHIKATGLLSERRFQVYNHVYMHGPCTGTDVSRSIPGGWKRLSELQELGLVEEIGDTKCPYSGETVSLWDVTDHVPTTGKLVRPKKACARCAQLEAQLKELLEGTLP